jgi:MFS family permease
MPSHGTTTEPAGLPRGPSAILLRDSAPAPAADTSWVPATFRALRHRNYRLYFLGQLISLLGTLVQSTALMWLTYQLTHESGWTSLIAAIQVLPAFFLGPLGGALADRCPKRSLIFWTQAIYLVLALVLAFLVLGGAATRWYLLVIALANGLVNAVDLPARLAFVMDMVGRDDLVNAVALNSLLFNVARALGPALGGLLLLELGAGVCFLLNGLSYFAVLAALAAMDVDGLGSPGPGKDRGGLLALLDGFGYLARKPALAGLVGLAGVLTLFGWSFIVLLPALAQRQLGVREQGYGLLLSGTGLGALVAALLVAKYGSLERRRLFLVGGACLTTAAVFGLSLTRGLPAAVACCALLGCGLILFFATCQSVVQLSASDQNRGRIMGLWSMVICGALPLGNLLAGRAADLWTEAVVLRADALGCAATVVALVVLFALWHRPAETAG